jgi:hypothetical protein
MPRGQGPLTRKPLTAATPIRPKRDKPRRRSRTSDHGMLWPDVRLVIFARALGRCERCGLQLNIANMEGHHRRTRRVGPDCPCNALALCGTCHHGPEVHGGPELAMELGTILSRHSDAPPGELEVEIHGRGRVLLGCGGQYLAIA